MTTTDASNGAVATPAEPGVIPDIGPGGAHAEHKPTARAWVVLAILCFVYVLNFLDRQLLSILAKPIQDTMGISDSQLGLIGGLYFAFFYCFIAIPVGWIADKTNRVGILAAACAIWSAATIACGLARTYSELVVARMTVGFGEAGGVPPSYAIITDYFPKGTARHRIGTVQSRPAYRCSAWHRVRRVHRGRLQLARRLHRPGRRRTGRSRRGGRVHQGT
jgi:hypothetical protein